MADTLQVRPTVISDYPNAEYAPTGLLSLDMALGRGDQSRLGLPLRATYEVYAKNYVGKSTLVNFMAASIHPSRTIWIAPFEPIDRDFLEYTTAAAGFTGTVRTADIKDKKGRNRSHEDMLEDLAEALLDEETQAVVIDSVTAAMPTMEALATDFTSAFMGRRAQMMAKFVRRAPYNMHNAVTPKAVFLVNHDRSMIGGMVGGRTTSGGEAIKDLANVRMHLWTKRVIKKGDDITGFVIEGQVEKLKFGPKGRKFRVFLLPGYGISREMSAIFDLIDLGVATSTPATIKIGDKGIGPLNQVIAKAYKPDHNPACFGPVMDALEEYKEEHRFDLFEITGKGGEEMIDGGDNEEAGV